MGRRKRGAPPPYLLHRATGQAYSTWRGRISYHGKWNTPESRQAYSQFLATWEREEGAIAEATQAAGGTVAQLAALYQVKVAVHFSRPERTNVKQDLGDLIESYGTIAPDDFGPSCLKALRDGWIERGNARPTVNKKAGRIKRVFRWGVEEELVEPITVGALDAVADLKLGRTEAPEYNEVHPVSMRDLAATLRELKPESTVARMIRWQHYVGCRPGECCRAHTDHLHRGVVRVRGRTIKIPPGMIAWTPPHKNLLKGKVLIYLVGPRAQALIPDVPSGFLFLSAHRRPYRLDRYEELIEKACKRAGVPTWVPNQLRHLWFSRMDRIAGIARASEAGGHASVATTAIYVERSIGEAGKLAAKHG